MKRALWSALVLSATLASVASAPAFELIYGDPRELNGIQSTDISLFGIKLGDSEDTVQQLLGVKDIAVRVEREGTFILLLDAKRPTGPMAGIRFQDGKVDLIFINKRFAKWTRGSLRTIIESQNPCETRELFNPFKEKPGVIINCLPGDVNVEFTLPGLTPEYR